ncbi:CASP-like protein 5C3 [Miscanthus floridulus]|uniref:CASP-like protein 5C3 n=1 Tax=Miscanthus floridulus TaxID=154761 RepID=UPI00345A8A1C
MLALSPIIKSKRTSSLLFSSSLASLAFESRRCPLAFEVAPPPAAAGHAFAPLRQTAAAPPPRRPAELKHILEGSLVLHRRQRRVLHKPVASLLLHTTMKKTLVVASLLTCRVATLVLCCASLARMAAAPVAMNYSVFRFLMVVLTIQLPFCVTRLLHDVTIVVFHVPPPGNLTSTLIVIFEWILSVLVLAASSSALSVEVYMDKDTGACMFMQPQPCRWYKEAALLGLLAWVFSYAIALLLIYLQSSRHAQPPAPAPAHGHDQG